MRDESQGTRGFTAELKRRHVYDVAVAYGAGCFIILQVAELVLPVLPLPEWSYSALLALLVACFPPALILGWIFDVRISRTGSRSRAR